MHARPSGWGWSPSCTYARSTVRWSTPRRSPPSPRRRCSPTAAPRWPLRACRSTRGWHSRRSRATRSISTPRAAPRASPGARAGAERALGYSVPPANSGRDQSMAYFVTGATGFIGRHLVEQLLKRDGDIYVLVREGSTDKLQDLIDRWGPDAKERVKPVTGDLGEPKLGVSDEQIAKLREAGIDHYFHLAAIYDMTAPDERNEELNVKGTRNAVQLANALEAGVLHHTSSI